MERKISFNDVRKALDEAYEAVKSINEGTIDPRNTEAKAGQFGITVTLADGTTISKGDVDVKSPMGDIVKIPLSAVLLTQNGAEGLVKKSGQCPMNKVEKKPKHMGAHGVRGFSAIEPVGDPDSKWNIYDDMLNNLTGGDTPILNDKLYEAEKRSSVERDVVNQLADSGYYLYDDTALSVDLYNRARAMEASTKQLAMMGATIAADGVNPATGKIAFDGSIAQYMVAMMAAKGPHKMNLPWLMLAGLPAKRSWGGAIVGVYPGVMSVAAYSPELNAAGVSIKAARAIMEFMRRLDVSMFASARICIENTENANTRREPAEAMA